MNTERTTAGKVVERVVDVTCEECLERYPVTLRATGSARGESRGAAELEREAETAARRNLAQLAPMEACPRCGFMQAAMVERMFRHPMHASLRKRYDDSQETVNSPYGRALRLRARGMDVDAIGRLLLVDDANAALWQSFLAALVTDEMYNARAGTLAARLASASEGERLAHWLLGRRRLDPRAVEKALEKLYGLPPRAARDVSRRVWEQGPRGERSLGLVAAGLLVLAFGALLAFVFGVAIPYFKEAMKPKPVEPDIKLMFPVAPHYRLTPGGQQPVPLEMPRLPEGDLPLDPSRAVPRDDER